jgi:hypothetical protein
MDDLTDLRVGRLIVLQRSHKVRGREFWLCRCDCGTEKALWKHHLLKSAVKSCGCLRREVTAHKNTKHGQGGRGRKTPEYLAWVGMHTRCTNPQGTGYENYGARGITICDRWRESFENFLTDMGPRPSSAHSVERKDNNRGYEPDNCVWATRVEQANNRRNNRVVTYKGQRLTIVQAAALAGIPAQNVYDRLHLGWSEERALNQPVRRDRRSAVLTPT